MANSARNSFVIEGSRPTAKVCRTPCVRCYLGWCLSASLLTLVSVPNVATATRNLVSRLERIWGRSLGKTDTGHWRIGGGWGGGGVRDPTPRIVIVICPLFPFWHAGRPM